MIASLLFTAGPLPLLAQSVSVTGQILHRRTDSRPLAGQWVVLQQLQRDRNVPLDSVRTDGAGRFRLILATPDTGAHYLLTTTYQDVGYFSETFQVAKQRRLETEPIVVFDTTTAGPPMRLDRRLVALFRTPDRRGLTIHDMIEVSNPGNQTRVAPDTLHPVWALALPGGATGWAPLEGNLALETIWVSGDSVKVFAPIWPGAPLRASFEYAVAGSSTRIPVGQWTGELGILVEDTTATVSGARFVPLAIREMDGRRFAAYRAGPVEAGSDVSVAFSGGPLRAEQLIPYLVGAVALVLAWGLWVAVRRKPNGRRALRHRFRRD